ncbi:MAG TPA: hypothetical protein VMY59_08945 [Candidatus Thermoplasmatota archaeon]|nr:hypothetical protein [Candidatus Thermoplasmatota archaeon]
MFNWSNPLPDMPRLTDLVDNSRVPNIDFLRIFTYAWSWFLGGWFFAIVLGGLAGALYIKYNNTTVPLVFLLLMVILFGGIFSATPVGIMSAEFFTFIVVVLAAFSIGFLLYTFFVGKK